MPRSRRFKGVLARRIVFGGAFPSTQEEREAIEQYEATETDCRMRQLFAEYRLKYGEWEDLCYALAFDRVDGFKFDLAAHRNRGGRKPHLTAEQRTRLFEEVATIQTEARRQGPKARVTAEGAISYLVTSGSCPHWQAPQGFTNEKWISVLTRAYQNRPK